MTTPPSSRHERSPIPLLAALVAALSGACGEEPAHSAQPPHGKGDVPVVLIVVDTLRADAVLDPDGRYQTPAIDSLARDGVSFPLAFAQAPMTLPSHTAMFSSRLPMETGVLNNGQHVPDDLPLLAGWLGDAGYRTRAVISLGTLSTRRDSGGGIGRGFDDWDEEFLHIARAADVDARLAASLERAGIAGAGGGSEPFFLFAHYCDPHEPYDSHDGPLEVATIRFRGEELGTMPVSCREVVTFDVRLEPGQNELEVAARVPFRMRAVRATVGRRILESEVERRDEPVTSTTFTVHVDDEGPVEARLQLWGNDVFPREEIPERYAEEVAYVDLYVGRLLDRLRDAGLYDRSLIVFTSDHGEALGENGPVGHVQRLTDEMIHVPLVIKLPAGDPRGPALAACAGDLVSHVDVVPTILQLLDLPPLPGQSGSSVLDRRDAVHVAETHKPEARTDRVCFRDERFKMVYVKDDDRFLMFDLETDPDELQDVFAERSGERPAWPERLRALAGRARGGDDDATMDAETAEDLRALGYGG